MIPIKLNKLFHRLISTVLFAAIFSYPVFAEYTNGPDNRGYNRTEAAQYIYDYTVTPNSAYFDYSQLGGDCTNFVSQVLAAGGMQMTPPVSNPTNDDWYYYGPSWGATRTATWTNAHCFSYYWIDINNFGYRNAYSYRKYRASDFYSNSAWYSIFSFLEPGDVIQFVNPYDYVTYHSQAVHRTSFENGEFKISVGQHTGNGWRNMRNYICGLPGDTMICLIKIKQPAGTDVGYLGSYSGNTVKELEMTESYLFSFIPSTEMQEDQKWSRLGAIKEELIKRVKTGKGIKEFVAPISKKALDEFLNIRIENNSNIINSISYNASINTQSAQIISECEEENTILENFSDLVSSVDEKDDQGIRMLWNEYWNDVIKQTPPLYYH